jgi:CheY-like chemotaxis protein
MKILLDSQKQGSKLRLITRHYVTSILRAEDGQKSRTFRQFTGRTALAVEDMKMNLILITKLLSKHGLHVDSAANGLIAVEKIKYQNYDIVFMDCQMPEMDGFEATAEIRKNEKAQNRKHTAIVALTADAMTGDRDKCIKAGMDDYLNKPVRAKEIADMLTKWIEGNRSALP